MKPVTVGSREGDSTKPSFHVIVRPLLLFNQIIPSRNIGSGCTISSTVFCWLYPSQSFLRSRIFSFFDDKRKQAAGRSPSEIKLAACCL